MRVFVLIAAIFVAASSHADTHFVATNSPTPTPPYTNWATAARQIQQAVDQASPGDTVLVTNGIYDAGGAFTPGYSQSNRVVLYFPVTLMSVNGPTATIIRGKSDPLTGNYGSNALRCAVVQNNAVMIGFTLEGGSTATEPFDIYVVSGGGLFVNDGSASNCIIRNCSALYAGGGVTLNGVGSTLDNCIVVSNGSPNRGGGIFINGIGQARNSLIANNGAAEGGGLYAPFGILENCTVAENTGSNAAGGIYSAGVGLSVVNSIVWENFSPSGVNVLSTDTNISWSYSFTTPLPTGAGNRAVDPQFFGAGNYHLRATSPAIDGGTNLPWHPGTFDLDGDPRTRGVRPDAGSDEAYDMSCIAISNVGGVAFSTWDTIRNGVFLPQFRTNPVTGTWSNLPNVTATTERVTIRDPAGTPRRSYRLNYFGP